MTSGVAEVQQRLQGQWGMQQSLRMCRHAAKSAETTGAEKLGCGCCNCQAVIQGQKALVAQRDNLDSKLEL